MESSPESSNLVMVTLELDTLTEKVLYSSYYEKSSMHNCITVGISQEQESLIEDFMNPKASKLVSVKATAFKSALFPIGNNNYLRMYPSTRNPAHEGLTCVLAPQNMKKAEGAQNKQENFYGLIVSPQELKYIFALSNMTKAKFMSYTSGFEERIKFEENRKIVFSMTKTSTGPFATRKIDIRLYVRSEKGVWVKTRYGISLSGYDQLKSLAELSTSVTKLISEFMDFNKMCDFFTEDLCVRFSMLNLLLKENGFSYIKPTDSAEKIHNAVVDFMFNKIINHYSDQFVMYNIMKIGLGVAMSVENLFEVIFDKVVCDVKDKLSNEKHEFCFY